MPHATLHYTGTSAICIIRVACRAPSLLACRAQNSRDKLGKNALSGRTLTKPARRGVAHARRPKRSKYRDRKRLQRGVFAVAWWNFGVNGGSPPQSFLLTGFESNNSNGLPHQKGRLHFPSANSGLIVATATKVGHSCLCYRLQHCRRGAQCVQSLYGLHS